MMPTPKATPLSIDDRPVVFGYVLATSTDEIEIAARRKEITHFCTREGYRLEVIFTDREEIMRPGFTGLLDVLAFPATHGVVIASLDDLSPDADTRASLYHLIRRTSSVVIEVYDAPDDGGEPTDQEVAPDA